MTIAINTGLAFDIETYDGLIAFVTAHLELDAETVAQLPSLIRKAEARLDRLCVVPERETAVSVTTTAGEQNVSLPIDYRHLHNARLLDDTGAPLEQVPLATLYNAYSSASGRPTVYAVTAGALLVGPVPDAEYAIRLIYTTKLPNLSPANQTNWLLQNNPDAYIYAVLFQTSTWLEDLDAATAYRSELFTIIEEVNKQGNRYRRVAPMRLRSPVVV